MQIVRHMAGALAALLVFIMLTILGIATGGAGWVALSLLCAWPLFWAITAWTLRGLKITVTRTDVAASPTVRRKSAEVYN